MVSDRNQTSPQPAPATWDSEAEADARASAGDARASRPARAPAPTEVEDEHGSLPPSPLPRSRPTPAATETGDDPTDPAPPIRAVFTPPPAPPAPLLPERYADRGLLGMGGMGEVRRVYDRVLDRMVAMKLVRADRSALPEVRQHFVAEARATARLAHPGIVPVHDQGTTPDGRLWFTMEEIRGETLSALIERLHLQDGGPEGHRELPAAAFRRLVDVLERAARAVSYAHAQGVVHRDIKPSNLLVGQHGEVMVVDWGLVRPAGIERGKVQGTPVYMAPEQARGGSVDARSDVYGLGMVLWEICAGHHPFPGAHTNTVLECLTRGEVPGPPPSPWPVPDELLALLASATHNDPAARPADGGAFADHLRAWLDGEGRREKARARVQAALALEASIDGLRAEEAAARARLAELQAKSRPWEPDTTREAAWAVEDEANALLRRITVANREIEGELEAALIHDPDAVEAHALLARRIRTAQAEAEAKGLAEPAADLEVRLRRHTRALPKEHPERRRTEAWLQGDGAVTLVTDPPGARVELHRYVTRRRRLVPEHVRTLGTTPLVAEPLPRGSWLLELHAPGRAVVRYPVFIERETHWDGVAPGDTSPTPIHLPREDELGPDDRYVPAGWVDVGGDPLAPAGLPALRVWVDGFVVRRFPVTHGEYIRFLDDLVARGRVAEAERYAPRDRGATPQTWGDILYGRSPEGGFRCVTDADGDTWLDTWPAMMIDHAAAWAYANWIAETTGRPWRLPGELEWEKAARGVDRRIFPWGDLADPTWCCNRLAFAGALAIEPVGTRPTDESPYGVRDLAGGMLEWTATRMSVQGTVRSGERASVADGSGETEAAWEGRTASWRVAGRGGSLLHDLNASRCGFRVAIDPWLHGSNIGFRVARSVGR